MSILQQLDNRFQKVMFVVAQAATSLAIVLLAFLLASAAEGKENQNLSIAFAAFGVTAIVSVAALIVSQRRHGSRT